MDFLLQFSQCRRNEDHDWHFFALCIADRDIDIDFLIILIFKTFTLSNPFVDILEKKLVIAMSIMIYQ